MAAAIAAIGNFSNLRPSIIGYHSKKKRKKIGITSEIRFRVRPKTRLTSGFYSVRDKGNKKGGDEKRVSYALGLETTETIRHEFSVVGIQKYYKMTNNSQRKLSRGDIKRHKKAPPPQPLKGSSSHVHQQNSAPLPPHTTTCNTLTGVSIDVSWTTTIQLILGPLQRRQPAKNVCLNYAITPFL